MLSEQLEVRDHPPHAELLMDNCPKCNDPMEATPGTFYWRGRYFAGLVCKRCNALYDNPKDSFFAFVATNPPPVDTP